MALWTSADPEDVAGFFKRRPAQGTRGPSGRAQAPPSGFQRAEAGSRQDRHLGLGAVRAPARSRRRCSPTGPRACRRPRPGIRWRPTCASSPKSPARRPRCRRRPGRRVSPPRSRTPPIWRCAASTACRPCRGTAWRRTGASTPACWRSSTPSTSPRRPRPRPRRARACGRRPRRIACDLALQVFEGALPVDADRRMRVRVGGPADPPRRAGRAPRHEGPEAGGRRRLPVLRRRAGGERRGGVDPGRQGPVSQLLALRHVLEPRPHPLHRLRLRRRHQLLRASTRSRRTSRSRPARPATATSSTCTSTGLRASTPWRTTSPPTGSI